jgi:hypothetical protein
MDEISEKILHSIFDYDKLEGQLIPREIFLDKSKYEKVKEEIPEMKKLFSSSSLTSLHSNATDQRWPLLNLARQILNVYGYHLKPIRRSDGYTKEGVKKFKRFFLIDKSKTI